MGQGESAVTGPKLTTEEIHHKLATRFASKCFTPLELYSFQDVFKSLADTESHVSYLREDTIARFLEIPDILGVSSVLFQIISYLGAFPFGQDAPVVLGFEQMVMVVVIMTQRYQKVLKKGNKDRTKLLFQSLAVYDRKETNKESQKGDEQNKDKVEVKSDDRSHVAGFAVDEATEDFEEDDDDDLALAAFEALDINDILQHGDAHINDASIPTDNLKRLIMFLLLIAPLGPQERISQHTSRLEGQQLEGLRTTADSILAAFVNVEKFPGAKIHKFNTVIPVSLPYLFNGFNSLFENFLFSKSLDFNKHKDGTTPEHPLATISDDPLLPEGGEILDLNVLSQLSFFIPGTSLFRQLRLLYSGGDAGFSMGSYETKVFNWRAPTILLVSGNRISDPPTGGQERAYTETLPPKRFPDSSTSSRVVFGVYLSQPWRQTHKECFGESDTLLFQLEPVHEVFHASTMNKDYVSFTKPPLQHPGIAFGSPHPKSRGQTHVSVGPVSLVLDSSFEFGVFTHNYTSGGGAFHQSQSRKRDWQDRFQIDSLEVWGCGGNEEAEKQRERWAWEEREAEARRRVNLGTGDIEADRALLEMAGLIGQNRSGGSMN